MTLADPSGRVAGKKAFVTGAGSGLGRQIALRLAQEGARVMLADLDADALADTRERIGPAASLMVLDVRSEDAWVKAEKEIRSAFGRLDILVNSAGIARHDDTLETCSLESWQAVLDVNVTGTFLGCRVAVALMRDGGGSIINLGSVRSVVSSAETMAYSTSKAAILGLTRSAALHCAGKDYAIRVNAICPGAIETAMQHAWLDQEEDRAASRARMIADYPLGRLGEPDDVAWMAVYLASDEARFVTGAHFLIDGGFTA